MIERILLASDGSNHAAKATETAIDLATQLPNANITIFHVRASSPKRGDLVRAKFDVETLVQQEAKQAIKTTLNKFHQAGVRFMLEVALGDPAIEIVQYAEKEKFDLIIIGSRGLNTLGEVLLGSVSHKVVHEAVCPVMVVK